MAVRARAAWLIALCVVLAANHAWAQDDAPTDVPDPVGLGERLALIDYLQNHGQQVAQGADLATLRQQYRALTAKPAANADQGARDAAALELWRTYNESVTPDETLAQIRARLDALAAKAAAAHAQELKRESDDSRAADATKKPTPTDDPAHPAAKQAAQQPGALPPPTGKAGADGAWTIDWVDADASSKDLSRPLLMLFTGSDRSPECAKLDKEVFSTPVFVAWAARKVVLLRIDAPMKKQQPGTIAEANQELAEKLHITNYPAAILLLADKPLGAAGYLEGGAEHWIAAVEKLLHR